MIIAHRNGMAVEKSILPPGARWVEYLAATGTQYIDTGIKYNSSQGYRFSKEIMFTALAPASQGSGWDAGGQSSMNFAGYAAVGDDAGPYILGKRINDVYHIDSGTNASTYYTYTVDGVKYNLNRTHPSLPSYAANGGYGLFAIYSINSYRYFSTARIYNYKAEIDEIGTVLDFRPIAIGTTGYMLDLLTGDYIQYGNKGTDNFIIGPDIAAPVIGGGGNLLDDYLELIQLGFSEDDVTFYYKEVA